MNDAHNHSIGQPDDPHTDWAEVEELALLLDRLRAAVDPATASLFESYEQARLVNALEREIADLTEERDRLKAYRDQLIESERATWKAGHGLLERLAEVHAENVRLHEQVEPARFDWGSRLLLLLAAAPAISSVLYTVLIVTGVA